nr:uncharacterized protein LOC113689038 [Coffea arabica]
MANARILRELAAPNLNQQPLCEEPYKHLQEFDVVCNSMKHRKSQKSKKNEGIPLFLEGFCKGLAVLPATRDRSIIDAASGGALVNKTPRKARALIKGMAENSQQFGTREDAPIRKVNEVKVCGFCTGMGHSTDMCPMIYEESAEQVNMAGHASAPRRPYDPYSRYQQQNQPRPAPPPSSGPFLEEMMKQLMATITQNQQRTDSEMQDIRNQMSQMATKINRLDSQVNGRLPSQPELNLKNVSAMTLTSGKEIQGPELVTPKDKDEEKIEKELQAENTSTKNPVVLPDPIIDVKTNPTPFPCKLEKSKKQDNEKEILEVFCKVEINIPLLDTIKQVPKYAKFLRDLCVNRKRLREDERVIVGENVSAVLQRKLPPKYGDPGRFTVPYKIEDVLVKVNELIFPADFYVLDMDDDHSPNPSPLLLGRHFLSTTQTKIDVNKGTLSMKFDEELVHFNIFDTMEHPVNSHPVFAIHAINPSVQEFSEFACRDKFKFMRTSIRG